MSWVSSDISEFEREKALAIQEPERGQQAGQEAKENAKARTAAPEAQLATSDKLIREQAERLVHLHEELDQARSRETEAAQRIALLEREKAEILAVLDSIKRSVAWKLVKRYRKAKNRFLPPGTLPRRLYDRLLTRVKNSGASSKFESVSQPAPQASGMGMSVVPSNSVSVERPLRTEQLPVCSIVIPVFNRGVFTKACLLAIEKSVRPEQLPYEVIVVDNGSIDETPSLLNAWARSRANARVVSMGQNFGFARACNEGARLAHGQYLVFLNNDTLPTPGWLERMVCLAQSETQVGIVGSKLLYPDGRIQHVGVVFDENKNPKHIYSGFPADIPSAKISREYQAVTGACLLVGSQLYQAAGGMDESYQNSYEETDLCMKIRVRGYRVLVCADSVVYHFEGISEGRRAVDFRNSALFKARWQDQIECDEDRWYGLNNLRKESTAFEAHEGYSAKQESLLEDLWRRVYSCELSRCEFSSCSKVPGPALDA
jgi:GT2 family glycosyltransferase